MFSAVTMKRLSVVVLERDERLMLRGLGALGAVHLVRTGAGPDTAPHEPPDRSEGLQRCDALVARIDRIARQLELPDLPDVSGEAVPEITPDQVEAQLAPLEARVEEAVRVRDAALQRWGSVTALLDQVSAYDGLDLSFDQIGRFSFLHFAVGSLPAESLGKVEKKVGENVVLLPLAERGGRQRLVAVTSRKGRYALETALEEGGFAREQVAEAGGETVEALLARARHEKEVLAKDLARPAEVVAALRQEAARPLALLRAVVSVERKILEAEQNFPRTDSTVLMTGWAAADEVPALRRRLQELVGGRCVVEVEDPGKVPEEEIPILLRHPRLLRPFEMLVSGYGLPGYRELEPTLFVAVTYVLMFGMMFGDAGQGGVLALVGLGALVAGRSAKVRDVGLLLMLGGASSVAFGIVYGSYFGITQLKRYALWRDPLEGDPMTLMTIAVGLGIVIISIGLVLNMINKFRRGDLVGGFLDKYGVAGAVFYWGVLALLLKYAAVKEAGLMTAAVMLVIVLPLAALVLKEPIQYALRRRAGRPAHGEGLAVSLMESLIEAFEAVIGYMANTISFVRLAAYAMSHAALLMATFVMAAEIQRAAEGGWGTAGSVAIIIVGNLVAILLEGVVASVQALRLEYYEFFGKFFSGSGRAFTPFRFASSGSGGVSPREQEAGQ